MLMILMELELTSCEIAIVGNDKERPTLTQKHLQMVELKNDEGVDEDIVVVEGGVSIIIVKKT